jgi:hypothetical protein
MGYGIVTTAFWGVVLPWDETERLAKVIRQALTDLNGEVEENEMDNASDDFYYLLVKLAPQIQEKGDYVVMVADGSDSRIESTSFEEGYEHGVGLLVSEKGYGSRTSSQEFSHALNKDISEQKAEFEKFIQPLLDSAGIKAVAELNVVSCTM